MTTIEKLRLQNYEVWENIAPSWERRRAFVERAGAPVRDWMVRELAPRPGDTVLELAAGVGETGFEAARIVGAGGRLISSDFSPAMLDAARRRGGELGVDNVDYRVIDAERIELESGSVDGVLCRYAYMLMADPAAALAEAHRVLRPGGRLALAVFGAPQRNPFFALVAMKLAQRGHLPPPDPEGPGLFGMASPERTTRLLEAAGFDEVRVEELPAPRFGFADVDEYLTTVADTAGPLALALRGLPDDERAQIKSELEEAFAPFATDGGYELPGLTLAVVATKPGTKTASNPRSQLLAGIPVAERRLELAGIPTAVLEGGAGPPVVLLHGPGESAPNWRWVIPQLVETHRVIAPDLPAHGSTAAPDDGLGAERVLGWLGALIERTCDSPPALVGHVLGGAIGARFAIAAGERLSRLVLVDSLGLARFRPSARFALGLVGFVTRPSERSYDRFMRQCSYDLDALRERMGEEWEPFAYYNLELARAPNAKVAGKLLRRLGIPPIPPEELARIAVPTSLIWGRHDRANRLEVAQAAHDRYGWPLHVIEDSADDPARDQPEAFLRALHVALGRTVTAT